MTMIKAFHLSYISISVEGRSCMDGEETRIAHRKTNCIAGFICSVGPIDDSFMRLSGHRVRGCRSQEGLPLP